MTNLEDRIRLPVLNLIQRRSRLLNLLETFVQAQKRFITLYAPSGYGKSILLADFAQTTNLPVCWCSLDSADRDPTAFLTLLTHSLADRFHAIDPKALLDLIARGDTQVSVRRLAASLADVGPHLIIIDDYHQAVTAGTALALNKFLEQLPEISTVIVAARTETTVEADRMIALLLRECPAHLSAAELGFTTAELKQVMHKRFGRSLNPDEATGIVRATAGNIAHILLTGHLMSDNRVNGRLPKQPGSDVEPIYRYLAVRVLAKQTPELQHFMRCTSVLPGMTAALCNELLGITNAQNCIEELLRQNLFVTQVGVAYKYHDLFAEFLRAELARDECLYRRVSRSAAELLTARARVEEAMQLYLAAQAWDEAAQLLETASKVFYDTGRALTLHDWLSQIPELELAKYPRLLMLRGRIMINDLGEIEQAMKYFHQAEQQFHKKDDLIGVAEVQMWRSVCLRMMGRATEGLALADRGLKQLKALETDDWTLAWAIRNHGVMHCMLGNISDALLDLRQALELFDPLDDIYRTGLCHHDIGICLSNQDNLSGAEHHYRQALQIWEKLGNANDMANTLNSLGVSLYCVGRYDEALKYLQDSLDIARQIGAPRRAAFAYASIGDVYLACRRYTDALEAFETSTSLAQQAQAQALVIYNLVKRGECFFHQQDLDQALSLAGRAKTVAVELGLKLETGLACGLQARIFARKLAFTASFSLFEEALTAVSGSSILEQAKIRLWWGCALLHDSRASAAFAQLRAALGLVTEMGEMKQGLHQVIVDTSPLLLHFLHRANTPHQLCSDIFSLLNQVGPKSDRSQPGFQLFTFGVPISIVAGERKSFHQRGRLRRIPEFLAYLLLEGRPDGCRWSEISAAIWPGLEPAKASLRFHQSIKRLRDGTFGSQDYIVVNDDYYRLNSRYYQWCDAIVFEELYGRIGTLPPEEALPLQLELIDLYQGEFLDGFELGEWGTLYRATCETRFLQVVKVTGEQLLNRNKPWPALTIVGKGLAHDYFREDLHQHMLTAYAQLGLYAELKNHYLKLRRDFERELDLPPEPATTQLYKQLMKAGCWKT